MWDGFEERYGDVERAVVLSVELLTARPCRSLNCTLVRAKFYKYNSTSLIPRNSVNYTESRGLQVE